MGEKKTVRRYLLFFFSFFIVLFIVIILVIRLRYGGGTADFPNRTKSPVFSFSAVEKVADLDLPPGNIAVSEDGRIFFSFHPEVRLSREHRFEPGIFWPV